MRRGRYPNKLTPFVKWESDCSCCSCTPFIHSSAYSSTVWEEEEEAGWDEVRWDVYLWLAHKLHKVIAGRDTSNTYCYWFYAIHPFPALLSSWISRWRTDRLVKQKHNWQEPKVSSPNGKSPSSNSPCPTRRTPSEYDEDDPGGGGGGVRRGFIRLDKWPNHPVYGATRG